MKRLALLAILAVILCSCAAPKHDVAQVRKVIEEMTKKSEHDMQAGIVDTTLANYDEDAVSLPNNGPMLRGKEAIRAYAGQMLGLGIKFTNVRITTTDVQTSGDLAYEIGTYAMTMQIPQVGEVSEEGKYLTVYEKAADGSWKIKVETYNINGKPPLPAPEG